MRGLKIALICLVGLIVALFGTAAIVLKMTDFNKYRGAIEAQVKAATGRDLKIVGEFQVHIGLSPSIAVDNVRFSNASWGSRPEMIRAKQFEIQVDLLPLLHGEIRVQRFFLSDTDILLETDAQGRGNWEFDTQENAPAKPAAPKTAPADLRNVRLPEVHEIYAEGVLLHYHDGQTNQTRRFSLGYLKLDADTDTAPLQVSANGTYNDFYFELDGTTGPAAQLGRRGTAFPVDLGLKLGASPTTLHVDGQLTNALSGRGYDLRITAATDELARLADFARDTHLATLELPKLGPLQAEARIVDAAPATERANAGGRPALTALKLQAGRPDLVLVKADGTVGALIQQRGIALNVSAEGSEIGALSGLKLPGRPQGLPQIPALGPYKAVVKLADARNGRLTLPSVKVDLGRDDLLKLQVDGQVADPLAHKGFALNLTGRAADLAAVARDFNLTSPLDGTLTLKGKIADTGPEQYALTGVKLEAAGSDIGGNATVSLAGAKPVVTADLASSMIDLGKLWPKPKAPQDKAQKAPSANPDEDRIFPPDPLPFEILDRVDADFKYRADAIRTPRGPTFRNTAVQASLHNGELQTHPLSTTIGNGTIAGELSIAGATGSVAGRLTAKGISLDAIDHEVPGDDLVDGGNVDADWELHGGGKSVRDIMAGLDGSLLFTVGPAQFRSRYADVLGFSGLMDVVHKSLPPLETTHLNCFVTRFDIAGGTAKSRIAVADTQRLTLDGGGTVNLKTEELDLDFDTKTKVTSVLSLMPPVHAGGTLAHPDFSPDVAGGALSGIGNILSLPADLIGSIFGGDEKSVCQVALAKAAGKPVGTLPPSGKQITGVPPASAQPAR